MMITSFLDSFEEARKTARERRFEKEANVFQGEGEKARSLLETYKEEQKQFEQNQQHKRKAKNEIIKLDQDIEQINNDISANEAERVRLLDDERNKLQEIVDLQQELNDLKKQGRTQKYTDTENKLNTAKNEAIDITNRKSANSANRINLNSQRDDKLSARQASIQRKEKYEDAARRNVEAMQRQDEKYARISVNGRGLRYNQGAAIAANGNLQAANVAAKNSTVAKASSRLKEIEASPYMKIASKVVDVVEFAIDKMTEYARLHAENQMRMMEAAISVSLNKMSSSLSAWQDALNGAYEAQMNAIASTQTLVSASNANDLANLKMQNTWTNWIPIWGNLNKMEETELELRQKIQEMELSNAQKRLAKTQEFAKRIDDYLKKQDNAIHQFQRTSGMSNTQTNVFEKRMLTQASTFASYNKTIEDAVKFQTDYTQQSGRSINMSNADYEKSMAVGRLVGDDNFVQFSSEMNLFNKSVSSSAEIMYDMYKSANKMGLSQQKLTKSVLSNMKLAEKFSFKNGVKGFMELAKWSENVRFNLGSLGGIIDKAQDDGLEGAVTQAAKLQVLGGRFAMGADPIAMQYEAWNDPAAYAKRIQSMFKGMGTIDQKTGETNFNGMEMNLIKSATKAIGMDPTDALNMLREDNKKNVVKKQLGNNTKLKGEALDGVINRAFRDDDGVWKVNMIGGGTKAVADIDKSDIKDIVSDNNDEALTQYAQKTLSVEEEINKTTKQINAFLGAGTFDNFKSTAIADNKKTLEAYVENAKSVMFTIIKTRQDATKALEEQLNGLNTILSDYSSDVATVNKYAAEAKKRYEDMLAQLHKAEAESAANIAKTENEQKEYKKEYENAGNRLTKAWYAGRLAEGEELKKNGGERDSWTSKGLSAGWTGIKTFVKDLFRFDDGVATATNGKPMSVAASNVVPIQDGVTTALSDPKDTAVFAKTGGPFDTLFNDVFGRINDVYNEVHNETYSNTSSDVIPTEPLGKDVILTESPSISAQATNDGKVQVAKSDSKGTATFAKTGGTFGTLFNDVFGRINDVYNEVHNETYSNTSSDVIPTEPLGKDAIFSESPSISAQSINDGKVQVAKSDSKGTATFAKTGGTFGTLFNDVFGRINDVYNEVHGNTSSDVIPTEPLGKDAIFAESPSMFTQSTEFSSANDGKVQIDPVNIKIDGKLELANNNGQTVDIISELNNNPMLLRAISDMIVQNISTKYYGGRPVGNSNFRK